jgi:hypothetical protein
MIGGKSREGVYPRLMTLNVATKDLGRKDEVDKRIKRKNSLNSSVHINIIG